MEQLWNRGGATSGKGSTRRRPESGLNYRQTIATGCHLLPFGSHGKEAVDGSSPSEGFITKGQQVAFVPQQCTPIARASLNLSPRAVPTSQELRSFGLSQGARLHRAP